MAKRAAVASKRQRPSMTEEHKAALAEGREQGRGVRRYLEALERNRPRRGRKVTPASIERRLKEIEDRLEESPPLERLHLLQERLNLQERLESFNVADDMEELEDGFVATAAAYGERKGISYDVWRSIGVAPQVLRRAGISR